MIPVIKEEALIRAANEGMDSFLDLITDSLMNAIGGELTADNMSDLNGEQITLIGYHMLRDEVMNGGFIQLIHNGLGPFIFLNPFAKAMRLWGQEVEAESGTDVLHSFSKLVYKGRKLFEQDGDTIAQPCSDEQFMALYEQFPAFDDLDDAFVEAEEDITATIARYVDTHLDQFIAVEK